MMCDKCGMEVESANDSVRELEYEMARAEGNDRRMAFLRDRVLTDRHLFWSDTCEGSPSRYQYLSDKDDPRGAFAYQKNVEFGMKLSRAYDLVCDKVTAKMKHENCTAKEVKEVM